MKNIVVLSFILLWFFQSVADEPLTVEAFQKQTGFEPGFYTAISNHDSCNCEDWIVTDEYGTLEFTSPPGCFSVYNIGQKKAVRDEGRCKYETSSRLVGKLLTFIETKTCGKKTKEDQSNQEKVVNTITVTFQENGFKYEIDHKVGTSASTKTICEMKKAEDYGEEPPR